MILVTGATGHIGNVLVRQLIERGQKVRALGLVQTCEKGLSGESYIPAGERINIQHLLESVWIVVHWFLENRRLLAGAGAR